jgi:hypothetical protein
MMEYFDVIKKYSKRVEGEKACPLYCGRSICGKEAEEREDL